MAYAYRAGSYCDSCGQAQIDQMIAQEKAKILAEVLPSLEAAAGAASDARVTAEAALSAHARLPIPPEDAPNDGWWMHQQNSHLLATAASDANDAESAAYDDISAVRAEAEGHAMLHLDNGDSDSFPQEVGDSEGESDTPTHCAYGEACLARERVGYGDDVWVGALIGRLTDEGRRYVCEALAEGPRGEGHNGLAKMWAYHFNVSCGTATGNGDIGILARAYGVEESSVTAYSGGLREIRLFGADEQRGIVDHVRTRYISDQWPEYMRGRSRLNAIVEAIESEYSEEEDGASPDKMTAFGYARSFVGRVSKPIPVRDDAGKLWLLLGVEVSEGREIECPFSSGDPADVKVLPEQAGQGSNGCIFCDEMIGDPHGYATPTSDAMHLCSAPELWLAHNGYGNTQDRFSIIEIDDVLVARPTSPALEAERRRKWKQRKGLELLGQNGQKIAIGAGAIPDSVQTQVDSLTMLPILSTRLLDSGGILLTAHYIRSRGRSDGGVILYILYDVETKELSWRGADEFTDRGFEPDEGWAPIALASDSWAVRCMLLDLDSDDARAAAMPKPNARQRHEPWRLIERLVDKRIRIGAGWIWRTGSVTNALLPNDERGRAPTVWNRYKLEHAIDGTIVAVERSKRATGRGNRDDIYDIVVHTQDNAYVPLILSVHADSAAGSRQHSISIEVPLRPDTNERWPTQEKPVVESKLLLRHVPREGKRLIELDGLSDSAAAGNDIPCPIERGAHIISGDCAGNCLRTIWKNYGSGWQLVHGIIEEQGALAGRRIFHAWLERDVELEVGGYKTHVDMVYDPTYDHWMLKALYYKAIKPSSIHGYTDQQATQLMAKTGHSGPWDDAIWKAVGGTGKAVAKKMKERS